MVSLISAKPWTRDLCSSVSAVKRNTSIRHGTFKPKTENHIHKENSFSISLLGKPGQVQNTNLYAGVISAFRDVWEKTDYSDEDCIFKAKVAYATAVSQNNKDQ